MANGNGEQNGPWYVRLLPFVERWGIPWVTAAFLIWFVTQQVDRQMTAHTVALNAVVDKLKEHDGNTTQALANIRFDMLRAVCYGQAHNDVERANCSSVGR